MKNLIKKYSALLPVFALGIMVALSGCSTVFQDHTYYTDSLNQSLNQSSNPNARLDPKERFHLKVQQKMEDNLDNAGQQNTGSNNQGTTDYSSSSGQVTSILRIPGSLPGFLVNPNPDGSLKIEIYKKDVGVTEIHTLLSLSAEDIALPPGDDYYIIYTRISDGHQWWDGTGWDRTNCPKSFNPYTITIEHTAEYPLAPGFTYKKLKAGSLTEYEEPVKIKKPINLVGRFGFKGFESNF